MHQGAAPSMLWGSLRPGPYAVGYRAEWARDLSRTWRLTPRAGVRFMPDSVGRPVRVTVWYPAAAGTRSVLMRFGDYTRVEAPGAFVDFARRLDQRDRNAVAAMVRPNEVAGLLALPMVAYHEPVPAPGRFPLVLVVAGLNAEATAQVVLAEFLASYGYVVAVVAWTGVNEEQFDATRTPTGIEATLRDVEMAWSLLRTRPDVDPGRLAVVGHSLGGVIAVLAAMRNGDVGAVVGLDATYGFASAADALTGFYAFAPRNMVVPLLDVRRAAGEQGAALDLGAEHAFTYSDRTFVTLHNIRHSEFSSYALIASATHQSPLPSDRVTPGWSRETASVRYQQATRLVLDFLDAKLKGDSSGVTRLAAEAAGSPGAVLSHEAAAPLPMSATELVTLAGARGFDAAVDRLRHDVADAGTSAAVDVAALNALGYSLLGQQRAHDAVNAFHLVVIADSTSANAFDSYGDGLSAAGRAADACTAYAKALALAPSDTTLSAADRDALVTAETGRHC